jgi:hypothetical protein
MAEQNNPDTKAISEAHKKLLKIAAEQGVRPVTDFESILGPADGSPEIGTVDEFLVMLREWRREGTDRQTNRDFVHDARRTR